MTRKITVLGLLAMMAFGAYARQQQPDSVADACQLKFSTESSSDARQRAYLDEITVTVDGESGINDIAAVAESAAPKGIYTLTGVKITADRMTRGFYIVDGKKVIK